MKTYLIQYNNELLFYPRNINQRGFTYEEAILCVEKNNMQGYSLVCLDDEIEKYHLKGNQNHKSFMAPEVYVYDTWRNAYINNNINNLSLPLQVETNSEYVSKLAETYEEYMRQLRMPAFVYESGLVTEIETTCQLIMQILEQLIAGSVLEAEELLKKMISNYLNDPFFVSHLDQSYSFRGIAPFVNLQRDGLTDVYKEMREHDLTFFRVRTKNKGKKEDISKLTHMVHLPYESRNKAGDMRFSRVGVPCLYLGTTTYVCSRECNWNREDEELYVSAYVPNLAGKKLKILNLTISQALINGIYNRLLDDGKEYKKTLQMSMLRIFPLVIATSFSVREEGRNIKYEYLISQALMNVLTDMSIDGIAYLSMKGKNEFQYPQGVNLALTATDITACRQYSQVCNMFKITEPIRFENQTEDEELSYINAIYKERDEYGYKNFMSQINEGGKSVFYGNTSYGKFDNYLLSQQLMDFSV